MSRTRRIVTKTPAVGRRGMVVAHNVEAAETAADILADGGSAFDAMVAASFVTAVREVAMNGIGGVGVLLAHSADTGQVSEINFYGRTPSGLAEDTFVPWLEPLDPNTPRTGFGWRSVRDGRYERGPLSVGIPTYVSGLAELHARHGSRDWADLLQPAIDLAAGGFAADEEDLATTATHLSILERFDEFSRIFLANGLPMPGGFYQGEGIPVVQEDLAATLACLARDGADAFYRGPIAEAIASDVQRLGGVLSTKDLDRYRPEHGDGLRGSYLGHEIVVSSGMTGGLTLLQMLNLAEELDLASMDRTRPAFWHALAEAMRQSWTDRFCFVGDPEGADVPLEALVDKGYAATVATNIGDRVADQTTPGDPWTHLGRPGRDLVSGDPGGNDTTQLVVADGAGNVVTLTQTHGMAFGSCVVPRGTGVLLHDITMWMNPEPGTPNSVGPWKKQAGHAAPVMVLRDGQPVAALGAPGGRRVITSVFQSVLNIVGFGMDVQEAIAEPRIHVEGADPAAPRGATVRTLIADDRLDPEILTGLGERGHEVVTVRETGTQAALGKPLGIQRRGDELIGGVDVFRRSVGIGI